MKKLVIYTTAAAGAAALITQWGARYTFAYDMSRGSNTARHPENAPRLNESLKHGRWAATAAGIAALYTAWRFRK